VLGYKALSGTPFPGYTGEGAAELRPVAGNPHHLHGVVDREFPAGQGAFGGAVSGAAPPSCARVHEELTSGLDMVPVGTVTCLVNKQVFKEGSWSPTIYGSVASRSSAKHMDTEVTKEFDATLATFNGHPHYEIMATGQNLRRRRRG